MTTTTASSAAFVPTRYDPNIPSTDPRHLLHANAPPAKYPPTMFHRQKVRHKLDSRNHNQCKIMLDEWDKGEKSI